jgi:hypothetical protein
MPLECSACDPLADLAAWMPLSDPDDLDDDLDEDEDDDESEWGDREDEDEDEEPGERWQVVGGDLPSRIGLP